MCDYFKISGIIFQQLWNQTSNTKNKTHNIPVHDVAREKGLNLSKSLISLHHLTGSDYTSKVGTKPKALASNPEKYLINFAKGLVDSNLKTYRFKIQIII